MHTSSDLIPKFIFIIMLASLPFACSKAIDDALTAKPKQTIKSAYHGKLMALISSAIEGVNGNE